MTDRRLPTVLESLAQRDRLLRRARMLPTDRALTPAEIDGVAVAFESFLREYRLTADSVAKALGRGFAPSVLSKFRNAINRGDQEHVARAINGYMELHARRHEAKPPEGFVQTRVAELMQAVIERAVVAQAMALITGPAGVGKTMMLDAAAKMMTGSMLIRISLETKRGPGMLRRVAAIAGCSTRYRCAFGMYADLVKTLKGTGRPLLVDEVHAISPSGLELLRDLHDECGGLPIVLCGTYDASDAINDRTIHRAQFSSRIVAELDLGDVLYGVGPDHGDGQSSSPPGLTSVDEIVAMFAKGKVKLAGSGAEFLAELANIPGAGGFRICRQLVQVAMSLPDYADGAKPLGERLFADILRQLHGRTYMEWLGAVADRTTRVHKLARRTA